MTDHSIRDAMLVHVAQAARVEDDGIDGRSVLPGSLQSRLSTDETALAEWRGLVRQARALVSLGTQASRLRAPADLDGRVVAALQAGHSQERAVAAVRSLPRVDAPRELIARVRRLAERSPIEDSERRAPRVLDRLVEEEITDHPGSTLTPVPSPRQQDAHDSGPRPRVRRLSRLMPAAVVMALVGFGWSAYQSAGTASYAAGTVGEGPWSFEVHEVDAASAPELAFLLDSITGGSLGGLR